MSVKSLNRFERERAAVALAARFSLFLSRTFPDKDFEFHCTCSSRGVVLRWTFAVEDCGYNRWHYMFDLCDDWLSDNGDLACASSMAYLDDKVVIKFTVL